MALKHRIEKLEKQAGVRDMDTSLIVYSCNPSEGDEAARKKMAVAEWEAINGPLGKREPRFFQGGWMKINRSQ